MNITTLRLPAVYDCQPEPLCGNLDCLRPLEWPYSQRDFRVAAGSMMRIVTVLICQDCVAALVGHKVEVKVEE